MSGLVPPAWVAWTQLASPTAVTSTTNCGALTSKVAPVAEVEVTAKVAGRAVVTVVLAGLPRGVRVGGLGDAQAVQPVRGVAVDHQPGHPGHHGQGGHRPPGP